MYLIYNVCKNVILTTKYNSFTLVQFMFVKYDTCICLFYTFIFFTLSVFMSVGWGVKCCPGSRIHLTTSLARKRPFEEDAREDRCLLIHIPDNSLITRLNHRCGVWWQEFQPHIVDTICLLFRIGAAIIHEKNNFFFFLHIQRLNSDPVGENFRCHPSVLMCPVANWKTFRTETPRIFALPDDEQSSLPSIFAHSGGYTVFAFLGSADTLILHHMSAVGYGTIVDSVLISAVDVLGIILTGYLWQKIGNHLCRHLSSHPAVS